MIGRHFTNLIGSLIAKKLIEKSITLDQAQYISRYSLTYANIDKDLSSDEFKDIFTHIGKYFPEITKDK